MYEKRALVMVFDSRSPIAAETAITADDSFLRLCRCKCSAGLQ